ncbi:MAG: thioredoxin-disulfide reductase [Candidatus Bathyarchaeia archaeon]
MSQVAIWALLPEQVGIRIHGGAIGLFCIFTDAGVVADPILKESFKYVRLIIEYYGMDMNRWDLVVIGAGPAGLTAGIYGARSGLKTLILEKGQAGGALNEIPLIENYPGFPGGISGQELAEKLVSQCVKFGAKINEFEEAIRIEFSGNEMVVETDKGVYPADAIIIASGSRHRKIGVPGEKEFEGRGVSYCALCDGPLFKGLKVLVVGGGNTAVVSALYLSDLGAKVYLAHRRRQFRAEDIYVREIARRGIEVLWSSEVKEIVGDNKVRGVVLHNIESGEEFTLNVDGVFILVGAVPNSEFARDSGIKVDNEGYIVVDSLQRTNVPGIYAAGDVTTHPIKQIGSAIGQAITASIEAYKYVKKPYYAQQK